MSTDIEKTAYENIEIMLETLKSAHTGINAQLEYLYEIVGIEEDELAMLKNEVDKLYLLNMAMQKYIAATLSEDFNSATVRDELLKVRTYRLLESNSSKTGALDWFAKKYLD